MVVFKKNQIVTVAMVALLVMAAYINFLFTDTNEEETAVVSKTENNIKEDVNSEETYGEAKFVNASKDSKEDYFNETKANKEKSRSEALSMVKEIFESNDVSKEEKQEAQQKIMRMASNVEKESNIENILMGKGFSKVSVYINDDGVTVAVLTEGLKTSDVAKIRDVILTETEVTADKIKIMEIK